LNLNLQHNFLSDKNTEQYLKSCLSLALDQQNKASDDKKVDMYSKLNKTSAEMMEILS
jgi:hypothetical protein